MTANIHSFCTNLKTVYDIYTYFIIGIKCMNRCIPFSTNVFGFSI